MRTIQSHSFRITAEGVALALLLSGLLVVGLLGLSSAPPDVSGDEVTFLNDVVRILHVPERVSPIDLMGDGSQSGINFYLVAQVVRFFSDADAVLGLRVASVLLSIGVLAAFYAYLRLRAPAAIALVATALLGTNYVFLNLARGSWMADGKGLGLICGLISFLLVEQGMRHRDWRLLSAAGALGGLALYGYMGTTMFAAASTAYIAWRDMRGRKPWRTTGVRIAAFAVAGLIVASPHLYSISQDYDGYGQRASSVAVANVDLPYRGHDSYLGVLGYQISQTVRGFLLLEPGAETANAENLRYVPSDSGPVDTATRVLFLVSLAWLIIVRPRVPLQPAVALLLMLASAQVLTVFPPNYARGVFGLLFVYMTIAIFLAWVWRKTRETRLSELRAPAVAVVMLAVAVVGAWNVSLYREWSKSPELAGVRRPSIGMDEVGLWVRVQGAQLEADRTDLIITGEVWQEAIKD